MFRHFRTNKKLWLGISAALFLMCFFFGHDAALSTPFGSVNTPQLNEGAPPTPPTPAAELWAYLRHGHIDFGLLMFVGFCFLLLLGIPALIIGWFIHCPIVMFMEYVRSRK
jgi:hypothetical protein